MEGFELDLAEDGVHHDEESDRFRGVSALGGCSRRSHGAPTNRDGDADEFALLEGRAGVGDEISEDDADSHGEEDPEREEAVEDS